MIFVVLVHSLMRSIIYKIVSLIKNIKSFMRRLNKTGHNIDFSRIYMRTSKHELKVEPVFTVKDGF